MGRYEISSLPWSSRQRISRRNFEEFWQVLGSAVIDGSFHNQFWMGPLRQRCRGRARDEPAATTLAQAKIVVEGHNECEQQSSHH